MDTRLGTLYLYIPKLRKGGYIPFFITERKRSELALMIAHGVSSSGNREILAIEPMFDESEDSWRAFLRKLKQRGLKRVCLCISDAHAGIHPGRDQEGACRSELAAL
jgi:transposase-like protein